MPASVSPLVTSAILNPVKYTLSPSTGTAAGVLQLPAVFQSPVAPPQIGLAMVESYGINSAADPTGTPYEPDN